MDKVSMTEILKEMKTIEKRLDGTINNDKLDKISFENWANIWLNTWCKGIVSDITYGETYLRPVEKHLVPFFGDHYLHEITPIEVQQFFNIKAQKYTMESCKKMKYPLHSIFEAGIENNHCFKNPVTSTIRVWSNVPNIKKKAWTQEQYNIAYEFAKNRNDGLPILILMETAISRSELLGLLWQDFDYKKKALQISGGIIGCVNAQTGKWEIQRSKLKNKYRHRIVPISSVTAEKLKSKYSTMVAQNIKSELIFYDNNGSAKCPDNWYKREYKPFMKDLHTTYPNVPILTTHELRHTRATLLNYQGVDLFTISRLMGHCDLNMLSKRYLHEDLDVMRKEIGI